MNAGAGRWLVRSAVAAAFLLSVTALVFWLPYTWHYRIDIDVYRLGGQAFLRGDPLYGRLPDTEIGANLPFTYPPIAAALFSVFALMPLRAASTVISLASLAALAWVVHLVVRDVTGWDRARSLWVTLVAATAVMWLGPVRENIEFGQINLLLLALVVTDALVGKGKWWQGALIGLAVAIKLTPAVLLCYFLLRREWRAMAMVVGSFLFYTAVGFLLRPTDSWTYWTRTLVDTDRIGHPGFPSNLSVNGFLHRLGLEGTTASVAWFVVSSAIGLAILAVARRLLLAGQEAAAVLAVGMIALFASPVSWGHHWVSAVPVLVALALWALRARGWPTALAWTVVLALGAWVMWTMPQWWYPSEQDARPDWTIGQQVVASAYLFWGVLALATMAVLPGPARRH